jgi:glycosyltransferase involved in cell wall biosynthesis
MNVGIALLTLFPGRVGGAETYVRGLLGAFAAGDGPELATALVSSRSGPSLEEFAGPHLKLARVDAYQAGNSNLTRLLAMESARFRKRPIARDVPDGIDVIHYPVTVPIPDLVGVPKVVTILDTQHRDLPQMFSRAERTFRRWAYDRAARQADAVITNTDFSADRIVHHLGIRRDKIHVIQLGIDHDRFTPEGPTPEIAGIPKRYVYYPANAWPHKNHRRLLEAFGRVDDPGLSLVLTGREMGSNELTELGARVVHLGHVPESQVAALYRGAQALIFPSLYEGFGFPPLEAMACGCPVAVSDNGAAAEVCGDAVLRFDPRSVEEITDAIERVAGEEDLRARLRARGITQAARFTWAHTARLHREAYREALARKA